MLDKSKPYGTKRGTCAACGAVMWRGSTSLPQGEAMCRPCRKIRREARLPRHG